MVTRFSNKPVTNIEKIQIYGSQIQQTGNKFNKLSFSWPAPISRIFCKKMGNSKMHTEGSRIYIYINMCKEMDRSRIRRLYIGYTVPFNSYRKWGLRTQNSRVYKLHNFKKKGILLAKLWAVIFAHSLLSLWALFSRNFSLENRLIFIDLSNLLLICRLTIIGQDSFLDRSVYESIVGDVF